jgi:hypothetical protein
MNKDPRPLISFPYLERWAFRPANAMRNSARLVTQIVAFVEGGDHGGVARALAALYREQVSDSGVVRLRLGGIWQPSVRDEPHECARVYASGKKYTRVMLSLPADKLLGTCEETARTLRDLARKAGGRCRVLDLAAFESHDDPAVHAAYRQIGAYRTMLPRLAVIARYWRESGLIDRSLAQDAAEGSQAHPDLVRAIHLDLSPTEHLLLRHLVSATRRRAAQRANLNDAWGIRGQGSKIFRTLDSIKPAVLSLEQAGWVRDVLRTPTGWEVARGKLAQPLSPDDFVAL